MLHHKITWSQHVFVLIFLFAIITLPGRVHAQDDPTRVVDREYYLKAAFLYQFTNFVEWPDGTLAEDVLVIGVIGEDSFGVALDTISGKVVQGRRIVVKRTTDTNELMGCAVIFIAKSEQQRLEEILAAFRNKPILTVSDIDGFASKWGIINFKSTGNRVQFEINPEAAKRARLRISSRLLRVAEIVSDGHRDRSQQ